MQQIEYSREIQWLLLFIGGVGLLLNTMLFHSAIAISQSLLELEIVRNARQQSELFARSCELYERNCRNIWWRVPGLVVSVVLVCAAIICLTGLQ